MTERRCEIIFGQTMKPCPKCKSFNLKYQNPIKLDAPLPDEFDVAKLVGIWARQKKSGETPLEGPCYLMCFDCFHKGPAVDCSGRTSEDVSLDP